MFSHGLTNREFIMQALSGAGKGASYKKTKIPIDLADDVDDQDNDDGYGVCLDEGTLLSAVPDPYDCCVFPGPDPPILDTCPNGEPAIYDRISIVIS